MGAAATNVPGTYDLVIAVNGGATTGFLFDDALESSLPFRTHRATYTYSPTFIERSNVQGDYGDNQQDFFLTATQRDWSLGEDQVYFRQQDGESSRRYWYTAGTPVNATDIPGQVTIGKTPNSLGGLSAVTPVSISPTPIGVSGGTMCVPLASSTTLYTVDDAFTVTSRGAHGLGAAPSQWGMGTDLWNAYISTTGGGIGVRKWNASAGFTTFSATAVDSLCFLDNTLYGMTLAGAFGRFDTAGIFTTLFSFKEAAGAAAGGGLTSKIFAFGGKVGILYVPSPNTLTGTGNASLWFYDGTGVSVATQFPAGFNPYDICVSMGTIFISGMTRSTYPAIYTYSGGNLSLLYQSKFAAGGSAYAPGMCPWEGGILFSDQSNSQAAIRYYKSSTGGISTVVSQGINGNPIAFGTTGSTAVYINPGTSGGARAYGSANSTASGANLYTSLFDFDSSLNKLFRGITVVFDSATDGDGGSVNISYTTESISGSYTSLQIGAVSGTEYTLSSVSGRAIGVEVTLNKGTSTNGPTLKKIKTRAVPVLTRYKSREYILDCSGDPATNNKRILRNGDLHPLSGRAQVDALVTATETLNTTPSAYLSITDRLGTYTGIVESLEVYEEHPANKPNAGKSGSFTVKITTREI